MQEVKPYARSEAGKKKQVEEMFDNISRSYDWLNRFLSAGLDKSWRKTAVRQLGDLKGKHILDVATGTGDVAFTIGGFEVDCRITGYDISNQMLEIARQKGLKRGTADRIDFIHGDSENMPFEDNSFDGVTVAFGVRNFEDLKKGLEEMCRVLKPGGTCVVLEFTRPRFFPVKQLFGIYFKYLLPRIGGLKSGDRKAYRYLFDSVQAFPDFEDFVVKMKEAGFKDCSYKTLSSGICAVYRAYK